MYQTLVEYTRKDRVTKRAIFRNNPGLSLYAINILCNVHQKHFCEDGLPANKM